MTAWGGMGGVLVGRERRKGAGGGTVGRQRLSPSRLAWTLGTPRVLHAPQSVGLDRHDHVNTSYLLLHDQRTRREAHATKPAPARPASAAAQLLKLELPAAEAAKEAQKKLDEAAESAKKKSEDIYKKAAAAKDSFSKSWKNVTDTINEKAEKIEEDSESVREAKKKAFEAAESEIRKKDTSNMH